MEAEGEKKRGEWEKEEERLRDWCRRLREEKEEAVARHKKEEEWRREEGRLKERIRVLEMEREGRKSWVEMEREEQEEGDGMKKGRGKERIEKAETQEQGKEKKGGRDGEGGKKGEENGEEELKEKEREERKRSIVIKGAVWKTGSLEKEVEEFLEKKLRIEVKVRGARKVWARGREYGVVAEMESVWIRWRCW